MLPRSLRMFALLVPMIFTFVISSVQAGATARPGPASVPVHVAVARQSHHRHVYRVRHGDTLTSIARREYGHASRWPALWWVNKTKIRNPNMLRTGQRLRLSAWHPHKVWLASRALGAIPKPPPPPPVVVTSAPAASNTASSSPAASTTYAAQPVQQQQTVSPGNYSGFQACVISRESGGNAQVMNSTGHYGLYQFSAQTWAGYGGNPADFGHASVAEQNQVFASAMSSPGGASNWSPYDGC